MIKVNSTVNINTGLLNRLSGKVVTTALEQTAEALHTEVVQAEVVPRMDGTLQNEAFSVDTSQSAKGTVTLVHSTPYARRLYFHPEYNFKHDAWESPDGKTHQGNPNAKGKWFEDWLPGGKNASYCANAFAQIYRSLGGL